MILHFNIDKKDGYLFFDNISKFKINDVVFSSSEPKGYLEEIHNNLK